MRFHPYIFKIKTDEGIEYFQGSMKGAATIKKAKIIETRVNTKFNGAAAKARSIQQYFETLEIVEPKK